LPASFRNPLLFPPYTQLLTLLSLWTRPGSRPSGGELCNGLISLDYKISYWREGDYEVDFVVAKGRDIWAIEVKSSRSGKTTGMTRFRNRYPEPRTLLVGGQGIPLDEFSAEMRKDGLHHNYALLFCISVKEKAGT
jgi:hypothetical protein